ncbi:MAG: diiron oxygenase [Novosphingobium sp.]
MYRTFTYDGVLASSQRAAWQLDDVLPENAELDFTRPFLPEALARTGGAAGLAPAERLVLNHIRGHEYLAMFGVVEEFILPFVLDHARPLLNGDDYRVRALLQFAGEEAKHIQLFRRFRTTFRRGFGEACPVIGPADAIGAEILAHDPLAVALFVLQIEWMTQAHYLDAVRADTALEPLFKDLLRCHWIEEAQHARLDAMMVEALAEGRSEAAIAAAFDQYLAIVAFMDGGLRAQAAMNLAALERRIGRSLPQDACTALLAQQHQAARWTFLGSGMAHPRFRASLARLSPALVARLDAAAPAYD